MSDLISRQAAIEEIKALYEWHDTVTEDRTIDHLKRLPSTDVVEVVRCKDCKHRYSAVSNMTIDGNETWRHECLINRIPITLDWYCSDGERRTDG